MCTVLNADCFFGIVLSHIDRITIDKLIEIRDDIQANNSHIVINLSGPAIHQATTYYPSFFKLVDSNIICRGSRLNAQHSLQFIKKEFSNEVSGSVLEQVDKLVSESKMMAG